MKVTNRHERVITAGPERVASLIADFSRTWPTEIAPAPRLVGDRRYEAGRMLWEEVDRPGALRAFRVLSPDELRLEHWFEIEPAAGGTVLRHTVAGHATGRCEALWRERIEPAHDVVLEALLDNVQAAVSGPGAEPGGGMADAAGSAGGLDSTSGFLTAFHGTGSLRRTAAQEARDEGGRPTARRERDARGDPGRGQEAVRGERL